MALREQLYRITAFQSSGERFSDDEEMAFFATPSVMRRALARKCNSDDPGGGAAGVVARGSHSSEVHAQAAGIENGRVNSSV